MSRPWMPWYIADFLGDTQHLDAAETGAYMLLLGHYWLNGGKLPDSDAGRARVCRMTPAQWKKSRDTLMRFFPDGKNKRADAEREHANDVSETYSKRAREAANKRWAKDATSNAPSMPDKCLSMPISQPQSSEAKASGADAPRDPKTELFDRGRQVLGRQQGGSLTAKLLKSLGNEDDPKTIAKARARIEDASTKTKPAEWLGAVLRGQRQADDDFLNPTANAI